METTKARFIKEYPKSYLATRLVANDWDLNASIEIGSGLNVPYDKRSNLYEALQGTTGEYVLGGHLRRGTEGWFFAVLI